MEPNMATKGDPAKQPADCKINDAPPRCPNIVQTYQGYDKETYSCEVCGEFYSLYYDDMA